MRTSIKTVVFWHPRICNPLDRSSAIYLNGSVLSILLISVNFNLRKGLINDSWACGAWRRFWGSFPPFSVGECFDVWRGSSGLLWWVWMQQLFTFSLNDWGMLHSLSIRFEKNMVSRWFLTTIFSIVFHVRIFTHPLPMVPPDARRTNLWKSLLEKHGWAE